MESITLRTNHDTNVTKQLKINICVCVCVSIHENLSVLAAILLCYCCNSIEGILTGWSDSFISCADNERYRKCFGLLSLLASIKDKKK